jgi:hypothetical protein
VAQLGEEIDGATQRQGGLVTVKPAARGVMVVRHTEVGTSDWVWHEEDGSVDLHVTG